MMKKTLSFILAIILCLSFFSGCAETPEPGPELTPQQPEASPEQSPEPEEETEGTPFAFTWENMPRMDGSTSLVPLAQAAASLLLGEEPMYMEGITQFNRTSQSYRNLMWDSCDILIASWPALSIFEELAAENFQYEMEPIATDALIFVVNESNPVDNLTTEQIIGIYTGEITNWSEVGGNDETILPFQRNSGAGSQALMEKLVMGDIPMMEAPTELMAGSMGELMEYVRSYDNSSNALGYSVYYYANDMQMAEGLKIIAVDGVQPTADSIRSGDYPHLSNYYTVIAADEAADSPARIMFDWLQGAEGQRLVETQGYVPVMDLSSAPKKEATPGGYVVETDWSVLGIVEKPETKFTRLREEPIEALEARDDYGVLYPFVGRTNYDEYGTEKHIYGLFDQQGRIVCDSVYSEVSRLAYYQSGEERNVPMLGLQQIVDDESYITLCTLDGSFVSPESYGHVLVFDFGVLCAKRYDSQSFVIYDFEGNVLMTEADLKLDGFRLMSAGDIFGGSNGWLAAWLDDGQYSTAWLIDPEGEAVFGDWFSADFCGENSLIVYGDGGGRNVGVMSFDGEWIVPPYFDYVERIVGGYCGQIQDGGSYIYDTEGNQLAVYEENVRVMGPGYAAESSYFTLDGVEVPFGEGWNTTSYFGESPLIYRWGEDGGEFINIYSGKTLFIPGDADGHAEQLMVNFMMGPTSSLEYVIAWDGNPEHPCKLLSWDLERVYEFPGTAYGMAAFSTVVDGFTGEEYICVNDEDYVGTLYNADMDLVGKKGEWSSIWNGLLCKTDESFCCYWDENGEVFFCYPMSDGGGD